MDGVLIDSMAIMYEYSQIRFPGISYKEFQEVAVGNIHKENEKIQKKYNKEITLEEKEEQKLIYAASKLHSPVYVGMFELLESLQTQGYLLTMNTGAWERNSMPILEKYNMVDFFDTILLAEDSKSKIEKFNMLFKKYSAEPKDFIFITDTLGDVKEANDVGVPTIAVTWGAHNHEFFNRIDLDVLKNIVDTPADLQDAIKNFCI